VEWSACRAKQNSEKNAEGNECVVCHCFHDLIFFI
jgi:hypothetical protein